MQYQNIPVITIDGPSGSGKGTIGHLLAQKLNWHFLDSGALYRLVALFALKNQADLTDIEDVVRLIPQMQIRFATTGEVFLNEAEVSLAIRTEECSFAASKIAAFAQVRAALYEMQRSFLQQPGLIADGRDMGTIIFPEAPYKLFLTASAEQRAQRRHAQLHQKGISVSLAELLSEIKARDERDSQRAVAPLKPAADALVIDTTSLTIAQVLQVIAEFLPVELSECLSN